MGEIRSYYCPEKIIEVQNNGLRDLILADIQAKSKQTRFVIEDETTVEFPLSPWSIGAFSNYRNDLLEWGIDPVNPPHGVDGHGYSLMLTEVLKHVLKDSHLVVRQTPAAFDFIEGKYFEEWGPSADIVIGESWGSRIRPIMLIDAELGNKKRGKITSGSDLIHPKLHVPIISMMGNKIFGNGQMEVCNFGMSSSPVNYAKQLAQNVGPRILHKLEGR